MIKANEAVVGRVFNRKHGKGWAETVLTEEIVGKIFSGSSEYSLNDFEPIPLDAEWIKRLGFVFNRELDGWEKQNWLPFHVEKRTTLYEWYFLTTFKKDYFHVSINHQNGQYVSGAFSSNGVENFWSIFKRGIVGTFHNISPQHIQKYSDEFTFRYNNKGVKTIELFKKAIANTEIERTTYKELTSERKRLFSKE